MTAPYKAPLRDMEFVYYELLEGNKISQLPGFEDAETETVKAVLEEAAKFAENVFLPLNQSGDEQGCTLEDGVVTLPDGFKEAYDQYTEGGWTGLTEEPQYGGMGLPYSVSVLIAEMLSSTNQSLSMYAGLTHGAAKAIHACGTDEQKNTYLPKFVEGTWTGTMCLTEPQCGTDLGLISTKAEPQDNGTHKLTGTKIFISCGEHELTENIIHLVLARLPDAPPGIKGISLFLVPKYLINDDKSSGERNPVTCGAIEHKMGIKGSVTCVINLDDAEGYMIGEKNKGMQAMFVMMNSARLGTGVQGMAAGEQAYQGAVEYARDRIQMRSLTGPKHPDKKADPIIVHPDVRRMLLTMRAYTEGCRAMTVWIAQELDQLARNPDPARREEADDLASLLTPVIKAFNTDTGFDSTNMGVQVFGGHGFISEHGMEQFVRDVRIAQLYEGTNGIQALDLVGRKMNMHQGRLLKRFFVPVAKYIAQESENAEMNEFIQPLSTAFTQLQQATGWIAKNAPANPDNAGSASVDYLRMFGLVTVGYMWARMAQIALAKQAGDETAFYKAKIKTARFYMQKLLPQTASLLATVEAGSDSLMDFDEGYF
ncbi:MAG: acyl-CoA dehydrogenase [Gammaproteobacteria bacterium]|nr:acyl-CoA dehydrogenase [Gammaproteobacteria bacterium]